MRPGGAHRQLLLLSAALLLAACPAHAGDPRKPGPLTPYDALLKRHSARYNLDWRLMAALAYQESRFDPSARSWAGARGLFQLMPVTGRELGFDDLEDPNQGIPAGIQYLARLIDQFEPTLPFRQRVRFALAAYNAGYGHVVDARRIAAELGLDPNRWFQNVERAMLLLENPKYYRRARHGFCRGQQPVKYVSEIQSRYDTYVKLLVPFEVPAQ
jgi:membrane-bound lytic murein transglycosylase F